MAGYGYVDFYTLSVSNVRDWNVDWRGPVKPPSPTTGSFAEDMSYLRRSHWSSGGGFGRTPGKSLRVECRPGLQKFTLDVFMNLKGEKRVEGEAVGEFKKNIEVDVREGMVTPVRLQFEKVEVMGKRTIQSIDSVSGDGNYTFTKSHTETFSVPSKTLEVIFTAEESLPYQKREAMPYVKK
jgi:hypothetical protein